MTQSNALRLLRELESTASNVSPILYSAEQAYIPLYDKVVSTFRQYGYGQYKGKSEFAKRLLMVQNLNSLIAAFHLLTHGYPQQSYSVMRPIYESLPLIDLFQREPNQAAKWIHNVAGVTEYAFKTFRGSEPKSLYGLLSELGSHRTFRSGSTMSAVWLGRSDNPKYVLPIGSISRIHFLQRELIHAFIICLAMTYFTAYRIPSLMGGAGPSDTVGELLVEISKAYSRFVQTIPPMTLRKAKRLGNTCGILNRFFNQSAPPNGRAEKDPG